jgi:2-isopropylmalate synthase
MQSVAIFDSTLRDGAQGEGISFSVTDKINIVKALDDIGVSYIEAGNPGSNPKDLEFFRKIQEIELKNSKIAAFGSTRRPNIGVKEDSNVQSLLMAKTDVVTIFGKSWDFHVTDIIKTSLIENLNMISDTTQFFKEQGKELIFDAEHFFDGYKNNAEYALKTLKAAVDSGADCIVLCDTNGGMFPDELAAITKTVANTFPNTTIGIHVHNDGDMAVANTITAVMNGVTHIQGTFIGYGERCGNANLSSIIANLELKKDIHAVGKENLKKLTKTSRKIAEISNVNLTNNMPYIGRSAFAHKGGMHIDGVNKASESFEHVAPASVGNKRKYLMSEVAGRSTILSKIQEIDPTITKNSEFTKEIIEELKTLEFKGYQFEAAESTFELIIRKKLGKFKPFFNLLHFNVIGDHSSTDKKQYTSTAVIKIEVNGQETMSAAEGDGPVNALDSALRKALVNFYPELKDIHLTDYKVRVIDSKDATGARVRVLIESTDGNDIWSTIGVSKDIIQASWFALVDSIDYKLIKVLEEKANIYL